MALTAAAVLACALLVYASGPWWGAPATRADRLWAAGLTVIVGLGTGWVFMRPGDIEWFAPFVGLLAVVAVVDRTHQIIPNRLVALMGVWAIAARFHYGHWLSAALVAVAVFLFYLAVNLISHGGLGMGDVKFSAVLALALGYPAGLVSVVLGIWTAGLYALALLLLSRRRRNQLMALGPFLALGGLVGLVDMLRK
ncbi:MAG: A24 family peptidase [Thermaerobacter sp.]|nr:A24 family peptidase [Thermaerobacter sp.]